MSDSIPTALVVAEETCYASLRPGDDLYETAQQAKEFARQAKAPATRLAYSSDGAIFTAWCREHERSSLPADEATVCLYITEMARPREGSGLEPLSTATIRRRLTSISQAHLLARHKSPALISTNPALKETLQGISRELGTRQKTKTAIVREGIVRILDDLDQDLWSIRDRALILVGFASALRRSELAAVEVAHLKWNNDGVTILIPKSKTDQTGEGREVELIYGRRPDTCPVRALQCWLRTAGITSGAVFRKVQKGGRISSKAMSPGSIGVIVKQLAVDAQLGDAVEFAGHSLRAGYVTQASSNGAGIDQIMKQTGHKSVAMVHWYSRAAEGCCSQAGALNSPALRLTFIKMRAEIVP